MDGYGKLYLVPTPVGNLSDISYRAVQTLKEVDLILAEDTRTSGFLLKHYEISTPTQSFHTHNEHEKIGHAIKLLNKGKNIAQISDAGTPGISDPGYLLVRAALDNNTEVEALPGATAFIPALIKSGFPTDRFVYEGFLPHKKGRRGRIKSWREEPRTIVFYESPHRLLKSLEQMREILGGDRQVSVSRELTKKYEETITGSITDVLTYFSSKSIKGEFVIVIEGKK
ncbi:MAG: 16S rRNA (cytidine(1402)-2'-O)-methyltransferase [Ekhidna sp.]|nr:16S rRNA (cytidine(1402)-2'-O)-methyltransferase [Ekhidna sp.]MBC6425265.1 16S rRNA (cytidine(1402)-2'-O)-methyltransferase [Ekhidna sp.]